MKILYMWFSKNLKSAGRFIEPGIIRGLSAAGHETCLWDGTTKAHLDLILKEFKPEIFLGYMRNKKGHFNSEWMVSDCYPMLLEYRKEHGLRTYMTTNPDMLKVFSHFNVPHTLIRTNRGFYNQAINGTPEERKLVGDKFVDVVTHIWSDNLNESGFKFWNDEGVKVVSFPLAADHMEYDKPEHAKDEYEISFIGGWWAFKGEQMKKFAWPMKKEFGSRFEIYGREWPKYSKGHISDEQANRIFQRTKIGICFHEPTFVQPAPFHVSERVFKVCASGGFALCDNNPALYDFYNEDADLQIVIAQNPNDMIEKTHYYLDNPEERIVIAKRGYDHTMKHHTYKQRVKELFNV